MLDEQAQSLVLLTAVLGKRQPNGPQPLSTSEWAELAQMLHSRGAKPEQLLAGEVAELMADWQHRSVTADRVQRLLDRGTALGLCLERWERAGLWVLVRSDPDYPRQLKRRLEWKSPPVLFGSGSMKVAGQRGLAVVGSRAASPDDLAAAAGLGQQAAAAGYSVVSGAARGVDETAMLASLEAEGTAVGVVAAGLLRSATSRKYRPALERGDLALLSPFAPEAGFHSGNAMSRNPFIYCLATSAVVVTCEEGTGGTWEGAVKNLRHRWVPTWARRNAGGSGNRALVERGARWLPEHDAAVVFSGDRPAELAEETKRRTRVSLSTERPASMLPADGAELDHYSLFLMHMKSLAAQMPVGVDTTVRVEKGLRKAQVEAWLKRAVKDGSVKESKSGFLFVEDKDNRQPDMFGDQALAGDRPLLEEDRDAASGAATELRGPSAVAQGPHLPSDTNAP